MRFIVWMLIHTMYRVEKDGLDEIPARGAAVLVCNHVSFLDPLVIGGCCRRPIRFVMDHNIYRIPLLNFVFRTARAIPIARKRDDPVMLQRAYTDINEALKSGDLICVFPEGAITRDGELQSFRHGVERIVEENPVPVIPMALRGLWGSFFSKKGGPAMLKWPRRLWSKIALVVGPPIAPEQIDIEMLYAEVLALRGDWK